MSAIERLLNRPNVYMLNPDEIPRLQGEYQLGRRSALEAVMFHYAGNEQRIDTPQMEYELVKRFARDHMEPGRFGPGTRAR